MKMIVLSVAFIFVAVSANAKVVACAYSEDSTLKMTANFDSAVPNLTASVIIYKSDGSVEHENRNVSLEPAEYLEQLKTRNIGHVHVEQGPSLIEYFGGD